MENIVQGQWFRGPSADLGDEIAQSLRFDASGYLTRAQTSSGDGLISTNRTFTFSTWIKLGQFGGSTAGEHNIFGIHHSSSNENWLISLSSETFSDRHNEGGSSSFRAYDSTAKFRDPHAWYHLFLTYSNNVGTLRVNNVLMDTARGQSSGMDRDFWIGSEANGGSPMQAYLAETYFIQGTAMNAVNDGFIRLNEDGVYVPSTPTISDYGTNGFHLTYDSSQTNGVGHDSSGNGNHFTATNFDTTSISSSNFDNDIDYEDTPTSNYATYNPVAFAESTGGSYSDANLGNAAGSNWDIAAPTIKLGTTEKWYAEFDFGTNYHASTQYGMLDVTVDPTDGFGNKLNPGFGVGMAGDSGYKDGSGYLSFGQFAPDFRSSGGIMMWAYDAATRKVWIGKDGTWYNSGNPANGTNETITLTAGNEYQLSISSYSSSVGYANFGQRPFVHTKPTGFNELQSNNLPEPTIKNGKDHFEALIYTGDGQSSKTITGLNFKPDLVWIKPRSVQDNHRIIDSVLEIGGGTLASNSTDSKSGQNVLSSFNNDGFTLSGSDSGWNGNTSTYVAWCWKAGGAPTTDNTNSAGAAQTAGSVKVDGSNSSFAQGSIAVKKMSVNTTAGFSIVEYQGTGSAGTIPHGLGAVPEFAIFKRHDGTSSWEIYHKGVGNTKALQFTDAGEQSASSTFWNNTSPTSTLFSLGGGGNNNTSGEQVISYIWTPIAGYSKFGDYDANGDENGPFVYTGFRPAFVLIKRRDSSYGGEWSLFDTARSDHNPAKLLLGPDRLNSERTDLEFDFLSNGFKIRVIGDWQNVSGGNYIYAAFAENPFGGANTPPATAR